MALRSLILDLWAPLAHKQAIGTDNPQSNLAPTWVPASEIRRLNSYKLRKAYASNVARFYARTEMELITTDTDGLRTTTAQPVDGLEDRREYGDAALLIDRVQAGVLGDSFELVVDGADQDLPDEPDIPEPPDQLADGASPIEQRVHALRTTMWEQAATDAVDRWEHDWAEQPGLRERQQWLRDWADDELFPTKKIEAEQDACGLGDSVYVLSLGDGRPYIDIYDPGFYFPVLTDTTRGYPTTVHLAWEFEETVSGRTAKWVRRLTWQLGPIMPMLDAQGQSIGFLDPVSGPDGAIITDRMATAEEQKRLRLFPGQIVRQYPWNFDVDGRPYASAETCYFTDARWKFDDLDARKVDTFADTNATFRVLDDGQVAKRLDLRHDFLPLVHGPNTPASREHYGQSVIDLVLQLLDDIQIGDTDIQDAAALAAGPVLHSSGSKTASELKVKPGIILNGGDGSRMDVLDMSKGLDALRSTQDGRLERLSINSRVPAEVVGRDRKDGNAASSGRHEEIRLGPFTQLIGKLRMSREPKDIILLRFVQRLGQLGGWLPPGRNPVARIAYGSFLPADRKALVEEVSKLLGTAGGRASISTQTAVALLVAGGLAIDDARGEVARIFAEDTKAAKDLADATGSEILAAERLGLALPETVVAPTRSTVLPPVLLGPDGLPVPPTPVLPPTPPAPA